ncbi:actin-like protein-like protein 6A [Xylona heveae TC161]|uniref:Actin-like protein-like protein 6A n=1 Tax=Xylona heveae (strain CBS 132557 / TC161) TaxID=1328760 RepID=A0A165I4L3_XYLHT|nr:actin-like protein-like protein 6A [Xylona heveae TC161]KZF24374.1 actin-like protein-like protein 6A [Xylona heveae TC161]
MAAAQSSSIPPSNVEYGGDEISAIVLDPGYSSMRAGFAGEDVPKAVVPSDYGILGSGSEEKYLFGDNSIHTPLPGLSIKNPMSKDGTVEDWDTATKVWEHAITSRLTSGKAGDPATNGLNDPSNEDGDAKMETADEGEKPLEENPLLMTETGWNPAKSREKAIELAMENWGCPAFWLARNGVLSAFAAGRASALVIDLGASNVSVTPVHDGLVLKKGVTRSPLAGNFVSDQLRLLFSSSQPQIPLTPHYLVSSKQPVDAGSPAQATYKTFANPPDASFRRLQEDRVLTEFKESVVQVWGGPGRLSSGAQGTTNEDVVKTWPGRPFEMPDGWNQVFGAERFKAVEGIFDAKAALSDADHPAPTQNQTLPALIQASLNNVDVDIRPHLLGNVVVTGGTSLLYGLTDRLNSELQQLYPAVRVRIQAPGNTSERRFASWIGGSIVASLGTFHQMWISKKEYDEHGAGIVEKRCK